MAGNLRRFNIFMHPMVKRELLAENAGDAQKEAFVELASTPATDFLPETSGQRIIKTHLPFSLLPPSVKRTGAKVKCVQWQIITIMSNDEYQLVHCVHSRLWLGSQHDEDRYICLFADKRARDVFALLSM